MTVSIISACGDTGFLSLDTLHYSYHQFAPLDIPHLDGTPEAAFRAVWCGDGKPPKVDALDFAPKVHALPHLKMAIGYAGFSAVGQFWIDYVQRAGVTCIEDLDHIAPAVLPQIATQFTGHTDAAVFHLGWSEGEQQVVGRMFRTFNGFQAEEFANCTVLGTPVHPEFEGHDAIIGSVDAAARGEEVEAFHVAIAKNIEAAYRAGHALRWLHFGGELLTAKVDRNGVSIRPTYAFKGYAPLNVLAQDFRQDIGERLALAAITSMRGPLGQAVMTELVSQNTAGAARSCLHLIP